MSLFKMLWLRKFMRRHIKPIPQESAGVWKQRLSLFYMLAAWNAFGVIAYAIYQGKADWAKYHGLPQEEGTPAQQWSKTLRVKDATVYRITGFNVHKYEIHNEFDDKGNVKATDTKEEIS